MAVHESGRIPRLMRNNIPIIIRKEEQESSCSSFFVLSCETSIQFMLLKEERSDIIEKRTYVLYWKGTKIPCCCRKILRSKKN